MRLKLQEDAIRAKTWASKGDKSPIDPGDSLETFAAATAPAPDPQMPARIFPKPSMRSRDRVSLAARGGLRDFIAKFRGVHHIVSFVSLGVCGPAGSTSCS